MATVLNYYILVSTAFCNWLIFTVTQYIYTRKLKRIYRIQWHTLVVLLSIIQTFNIVSISSPYRLQAFNTIS